MAPALELLHLLRRSLEVSTLDRLMHMLFPGELRVHDLSADSINALTLGAAWRAVERQIRPQEMEINIVGDFEGVHGHRLSLAGNGALATGRHHLAAMLERYIFLCALSQAVPSYDPQSHVGIPSQASPIKHSQSAVADWKGV